MKKTFLILLNSLEHGGVETLAVRMANWLASQGHAVFVALNRQGELAGLLDGRVSVELVESWSDLDGAGPARRLFNRLDVPGIDCLWCAGPNPLLAGLVLKREARRQFGKTPAFLVGIFHPREFLLHSPRAPRTFWYALMTALFKHAVPDSDKIFMSPQVKQANETLLGRMEGARVWPVPIDGNRYDTFVHEPEKFRLVSIGRLAHWKTYNDYMIDVVGELRAEGFPVTWEVYGEGEQMPRLRQKAARLGLAEAISFHGTVHYSTLPGVLKHAYAFVGMGTSLIESGFAGVPSVLAVETVEQPLSYGYLHEMPYYACGEMLDTPPAKSVAGLLRELFLMPPGEYQRQRSLVKAYVKAYELEALMEAFMEILSASEARGHKGNPLLGEFGVYCAVFLTKVYAILKKLLRGLD